MLASFNLHPATIITAFVHTCTNFNNLNLRSAVPPLVMFLTSLIIFFRCPSFQQPDSLPALCISFIKNLNSGTPQRTFFYLRSFVFMQYIQMNRVEDTVSWQLIYYWLPLFHFFPSPVVLFFFPQSLHLQHSPDAALRHVSLLNQIHWVCQINVFSEGSAMAQNRAKQILKLLCK